MTNEQRQRLDLEELLHPAPPCGAGNYGHSLRYIIRYADSPIWRCLYCDYRPAVGTPIRVYGTDYEEQYVVVGEAAPIKAYQRL